MLDTRNHSFETLGDIFRMRAEMFADLPTNGFPQNEFGELARNVAFEVGRYADSGYHRFIDEANAACDKLADLLRREHGPHLDKFSTKFEKRQLQVLALTKCYIEHPFEVKGRYNVIEVERLLTTVASVYGITANDLFLLIQEEIDGLKASNVTVADLAFMLISKTSVLRNDILELCTANKLPSSAIMEVVDDTDDVRRAKATSKGKGKVTAQSRSGRPCRPLSRNR